MDYGGDPKGGGTDTGGNGDGGPLHDSPLTRLALESLVDPDFYERLKQDPVAAARTLGIDLSEHDAGYLANEVHWPVIDAHVAEMREALHLTARRAAPLW